MAIRSLKFADLWQFETHWGHFCVINPTKHSKRRAQTGDLKCINLPQLFWWQIATSMLQFTASFSTKSLKFALRPHSQFTKRASMINNLRFQYKTCPLFLHLTPTIVTSLREWKPAITSTEILYKFYESHPWLVQGKMLLSYLQCCSYMK